MENILPGFRRHHKDDDDYDRHDRHGKYIQRPTYSPYEYTGQPVGFEHLSSPPKHTEMDVKTIAELGYEGPEGERRKVEAINEHIYNEYDSRHPDYRPIHHGSHHQSSHHGSHPRPDGSHHRPDGSHHRLDGSHHRPEYDYPPREVVYPPRPEYSSSEYPDGIPDGYVLDNHGHLKYVGDSGWDKHNKSHQGHHHKPRDSDSDDDGYRGQDERYRRRYAGEHPVGEDYADDYEYRRRYGVDRPPPVKIERKIEEDGTVVERIYPASSVGSTRHDPGRIHYGRQESFTDDIPAAYVRPDAYSGSYAPPYNPATSTYTRRPYEGSSDYVEERDRRY